MSVINQMLRDLDERRAPALAPAGTVPVAPVQGPPQKRGRPALGLVVLVVLVAAAAVFALRYETSLPRNDSPTIAIASPAPAAATADITPASTPVLVPVPAVAGVAPPVAQVATGSQRPVVQADLSSGAVPVGKFEPKLALPRTSEVPASAPNSAPAIAPASQARSVGERQEASVAASTPADPGQRQLQAGRDALVQAQSLWNSGSRDAALELLQQAMDAVQRNLVGAPMSASSAVLASLTREWSRMQMAEGRVGKVWETLIRLEPQLRGEPDLWAIRANAAQRLGRHEDSVYAYMAALESRPNEQRWLLGAAVSLAALGQTESATEMAEKGRAAGPISPEVQAYLRQAGVSLKEK